MKTKIFAILATGLVVLFLGAAPGPSKESRTPVNNDGVLGCHFSSGSGNTEKMRGIVPDSSFGGIQPKADQPMAEMNGAYGRGYGMNSMGMTTMMMSVMNGSMMNSRSDSTASNPYWNMMRLGTHNMAQ